VPAIPSVLLYRFRQSLPVLPTEFVKFDSANLFQCQKGGEIRFNFPLNQLMAACKRIRYPVLLRPDLAGTKCALPEPFMVDNREHMVKCLLESLSGPRDKDMRAIMVRRYLPIEPAFVTRFGGIGREWRLFAGECRRRCHHFYWEEKHKDSQFASYCNDAGKDVRKAEREIDPQQRPFSTRWRLVPPKRSARVHGLSILAVTLTANGG
jgi:hypothetical protein